MPALVPLESTQLTTTASSVTFNNGGLGIPQGYQALHLRGVCESNFGGTTEILIQFGSLTTTYSNFRLYTDGSQNLTANSINQTRGRLGECQGGTSTVFGIFQADIFGYNTLDTAITSRSRYSNWTGSTGTQTHGMWVACREGHTSVITSIIISPSGGSFIAGSTFSLYGWQ